MYMCLPLRRRPLLRLLMGDGGRGYEGDSTNEEEKQQDPFGDPRVTSTGVGQGEGEEAKKVHHTAHASRQERRQGRVPLHRGGAFTPFVFKEYGAGGRRAKMLLTSASTITTGKEKKNNSDLENGVSYAVTLSAVAPSILPSTHQLLMGASDILHL